MKNYGVNLRTFGFKSVDFIFRNCKDCGQSTAVCLHPQLSHLCGVDISDNLSNLWKPKLQNSHGKEIFTLETTAKRRIFVTPHAYCFLAKIKLTSMSKQSEQFKMSWTSSQCCVVRKLKKIFQRMSCIICGDNIIRFWFDSDLIKSRGKLLNEKELDKLWKITRMRKKIAKKKNSIKS